MLQKIWRGTQAVRSLGLEEKEFPTIRSKNRKPNGAATANHHRESYVFMGFWRKITYLAVLSRGSRHPEKFCQWTSAKKCGFHAFLVRSTCRSVPSIPTNYFPLG